MAPLDSAAALVTFGEPGHDFLPIVRTGTYDAHARYRMPPLAVYAEPAPASGARRHAWPAGGVTRLPTLEAVAAALRRPARVLHAHLARCCPAGARMPPLAVYASDDTWALLGDHTRRQEREDLQGHVYSFIEALVLCPRCRNPETTCVHEDGERLLTPDELLLTAPEDCFLYCAACGSVSGGASQLQHGPGLEL